MDVCFNFDDQALKTKNSMKRPISLIIIAVIFLLSGSFLTWNALSIVIKQHFLPLFELSGLLLLLVGSGLLRLKRGWRICALALIALCVVGLSIVVVSTIVEPNKMATFVGTHALGASEHPALFITISVVYGSICGWMYYVLSRKDIRELFRSNHNREI